MDQRDKVRENRMRRMAERQGLRLVKSRRRDPSAISFGLYWLIDMRGNHLVFGGGPLGEPDATLDQIEDYLMTERGDR